MLMQWMSYIADSASIFGLFLTAFVALRVSQIRKGFLLRARLPQLLERLCELRPQLIEDLDAFERNVRAAEQKIQRASEVLESISSKLPKQESERFRSTSEQLRSALRPRLLEPAARRCHQLMAGAEESLRDMLESLQWQA